MVGYPNDLPFSERDATAFRVVHHLLVDVVASAGPEGKMIMEPEVVTREAVSAAGPIDRFTDDDEDVGGLWKRFVPDRDSSARSQERRPSA